jgi:hypothetical protein
MNKGRADDGGVNEGSIRKIVPLWKNGVRTVYSGVLTAFTHSTWKVWSAVWFTPSRQAPPKMASPERRAGTEGGHADGQAPTAPAAAGRHDGKESSMRMAFIVL